MEGRDALRLLREYLKTRRIELMESFPKGMPQDEYHRTCGRVRELDGINDKLTEILKMKGDDE